MTRAQKPIANCAQFQNHWHQSDLLNPGLSPKYAAGKILEDKCVSISMNFGKISKRGQLHITLAKEVQIKDSGGSQGV